MLTNFSDAKRKKTWAKQLDMPIIFEFPDEEEFFELLSGWAGHHGFILTESSDHYQGFAKNMTLISIALLGLWGNGKASLYMFVADKFNEMVRGEYKTYNCPYEQINYTFKTLFKLFKIPIEK